MENTNGSQKNDDIVEKFLSSKIKIKGKNKIQNTNFSWYRKEQTTPETAAAQTIVDTR